MTRDCKHGQLARSCEVCESEAEVERLRAENDKLRAELLNTRELLNMALNGDAPICPVCGEPMTRRNDDGTLGCNLCYAEGR